jgi:hypothetical protein
MISFCENLSMKTNPRATGSENDDFPAEAGAWPMSILAEIRLQKPHRHRRMQHAAHST